MSVSTYDPTGTNDVIHKTVVDLVRRDFISNDIHLVQYDNTLPIIEVSLLKDGEDYILPNDADVNIRWPQNKYFQPVYKPVKGCSADRKKVYFTIDNRMVQHYGDIVATLEIILNESFTDSDGIIYEKRIGATSPLYFNIERNPIQNSDFDNPIIYEQPFDQDGTYVLEATVTNGIVTYNWVLKS